MADEAVAAADEAVAADIPAEVQRAGEGFRLVKRRRKALAPVARSRQEAQASKVEAVTRRIGRAVPARTRLNANKPRRTAQQSHQTNQQNAQQSHQTNAAERAAESSD